MLLYQILLILLCIYLFMLIIKLFIQILKPAMLLSCLSISQTILKHLKEEEQKEFIQFLYKDFKNYIKEKKENKNV